MASYLRAHSSTPPQTRRVADNQWKSAVVFYYILVCIPELNYLQIGRVELERLLEAFIPRCLLFLLALPFLFLRWNGKGYHHTRASLRTVRKGEFAL